MSIMITFFNEGSVGGGAMKRGNEKKRARVSICVMSEGRSVSPSMYRINVVNGWTRGQIFGLLDSAYSGKQEYRNFVPVILPSLRVCSIK